MMMDSTDSERIAQLNRELGSVHDELDAVLTRYYSWGLELGRWRIKRVVTSQAIFLSFLGFHLMVTGVGGFLILSGGGRAPDLGIALVVGGLFSVGSFLTSFWERAVDRETLLTDKDEEHVRDRYRTLIGRCEDITRELVQLGVPDPHKW